MEEGSPMEKIDTLQLGLDEIKADWQASSLDEKQNYVLELDEMAADATEIQSISGTQLLRDVGVLRDRIERQILPAQQKRTVDARMREQQLPGASL